MKRNDEGRWIKNAQFWLDVIIEQPQSIFVNKYSDSCNYINNPHAKLCVLDVVKSMNIKVFNLMSKTN